MSSFLKIYVWQILSLITGFGTLLVVTPFLSLNPFIFGVYSVVTALTIFFSYADLGFLSAGIKYISESVIKNDRVEEINIVGFVTFILSTLVFLIAFLAFLISFAPEFLIRELPNKEVSKTASILLIIFSISSPLVVFQRSLQLIFNSRLKDYLFQRVLTLFNLVKISSAYFFFSEGKYDIIGYYGFSQICLLIAILLAFIIVKRRFNYDLVEYFKAIKFKIDIFNKTKALAFGSLGLTIGWVLFYELDLFVIGRFIGGRQVAIFSLCLTIMTFLRSLYAIIYNPFTVKLNHYIGNNELVRFNIVLKNIITVGLPVTVLPPIILFFTMDYFILSWVGDTYSEVIPLISIMILSYLFVFVSNPSGIALMAQLKIKELHWTSLLMPGLYWPIALIGYYFYGLQSFAWGKFLVFFVLGTYYALLTVKFFEFDFYDFFVKNIVPFIVLVMILYAIIYFSKPLMPISKGKIQLLKYGFLISLYYCIGLMLAYMLIKPFRSIVNGIATGLLSKMKWKTSC